MYVPSVQMQPSTAKAVLLPCGINTRNDTKVSETPRATDEMKRQQQREIACEWE
jgi:hypothetical protein